MLNNSLRKKKIKKNKKIKLPNEGLEPSTTALRAPRSTD